jgi:succinate dehydrogenase (ubiquinone) cytochrome b560 subunit
VTKTPKQAQEHEAERLLGQQRLRRPLSPHLSIYRWQITSVPSSLMRITGIAMSGAFYVFGILYLFSPWLGLNLSSSTIAASFGALPIAVQVPIKFTLAWFLTFHAFNGLRYLSWDMAMGISNKQVARTGWILVIASTASALALAVYV